VSQKVLIVEDNKSLANLLAKKIDFELGFDVDLAYSAKEAKLFLSRFEYCFVLIDLDLKNLTNKEEVVDFALSKNARIIALSASMDKDLRKSLLSKDIIDYVTKSGINDINYIISTIKRVQKNREHTILLVDDSVVFRKQMQIYLENMLFKVVAVAHGEEAMGMLQSGRTFSLIITDYHMPVMDGLELTRGIRELYSKNELSIIALSGSEDDEVTAKFLKSGANDFIRKPFSKEEFTCRINNSIEALENINTITNHSKRDLLTGLHNRQYFNEQASKYFEHAHENSQKFAIAIVNIDHFKKINETYGRDIADEVIVHLANTLRINTEPEDIVARLVSEEFAILLKNTTASQSMEILEQIKDSIENSSVLTSNSQNISYTISVGLLHTPADTLQDSLDEADMLLFKAKEQGRNCIVSA